MLEAAFGQVMRRCRPNESHCAAQCKCAGPALPPLVRMQAKPQPPVQSRNNTAFRRVW